ncbi:PadR family transcriptional regulator [Mycolicibacterium vanbaalenii]|uniref:Transcriptional regulator, PadR family n=1 Tax=Mycolicibacterium vanbaalenii (strain DSM 7251 / JCM 13017 / BCRC 16820 / KCTC 9966 / NRRL B-24157 / PYR-1) TaxID=350058 RepID=A1TGD2_MYCVP|nr:PadR family transcriptional regulator [Mycolicibacterium vanbaalenii]ABM16232.1 transcriptional regulator, PadR family [Mycolicibacterium vanbaalenii PYR-1]MCV7126502.1 helix-turn-helix transcriptional regulator [Mycolicibacterium vanbaalenii PYR-1]
MNTPFTPPENPFDRRGFGFGFGPEGRRTVHERRRQARREFHDHIREHRGDAGFGPGPGGFGPGGFGPGFGGFGPGGGKFGPGFGFGPGGRGGRRGGPRGGGRSRRGDVRAAILKLLTDRPMHGYEMIQEINDRSQQLWKPSPGSIYPTLQLLVDEGLLTAAETEGSKKLFELTEDGRAAAEKIETAPWDEITEAFKDEAPEAMGLRTAVGQLMGAVAQSAHAATPEQQQRIVDIVNNARREIYQILGED